MRGVGLRRCGVAPLLLEGGMLVKVECAGFGRG